MMTKAAEQHSEIVRLLSKTLAPDASHGGLADIPLEQRQQIQALLDTSARVSGGIFMYIALWLIIAWGTQLISLNPTLVWSFTAWLTAIAICRLLLKRAFPTLIVKRIKFARRALYWVVLVNGFSWGLMTAASIYLTELEPMRSAMILVAVGICSAGSMAMAIDSFLKFWFPIALIFPVALGTLASNTEGNLLLATLAFVYAFYLMFSIHSTHRDYWRAMHANAQFERASLTDALTQVANRMSFDRQYQHEWRRASRHSNELAVLMVDLDHFKQINDTYGHQAGDRVLQHVANVLQNALLRGGDSVARYGGEEFVILLPQADVEGASTVAQRILASVSTHSIKIDNNELRITCSIGCALAQPHEQTRPEDLLKLADTALYAAKAAGRNLAYFNHGDGTISPIQQQSHTSRTPASPATRSCDKTAKTA
ncbi:putative Diguanylate cyclase [Sterolibacterium denitrificans]|uniref:diguanylate cyclase n=2 Tax=Sterolibacterium denitrificans TaxID=157592 RepID=A0A7Z7MW25_9PROT|nr:GGDEF domain-containing protein [Sterolibacterium denitrificans]SMB29628.1 putative Diguanylate cyclase [Sterolibacterium denitrificans]